jgi:predicted type IV restriction endonuclease
MIVRRSILTTLALAALLAAGGAAIAVAGSGDRKASHRDALATKLAAELDQPVEKVEAGLRAVARERLDAAVDRGVLTDEQRDAIETCRSGATCDRAKLRAAREARREHRGRGRRGGGARVDVAATLARELGVEKERVTAAMRALLAERLDSLVEDGWLTAAERDARLKCFDDPSACRGRGARVPLAGLGRP